MVAIDLSERVENECIDIIFRRVLSSSRPSSHGFMPDLSERRGLVPDITQRELPDLLQKRELIQIEPFDREQINTIGIDLRLSDRVWISDTLMQIRKPQDLSMLDSMEKVDVSDSFICQPDPQGKNIYYFLTHESITHSPHLEFKVDSRSTTGRVGCMSHKVSNGNFFNGRILIALQPYAFPIKVIPGETSTSQLIFRYAGTNLLTPEQIKAIWGKEIGFYLDNELLPFNQVSKPGGLEMTFSTKRFFVAKKTDIPIDLTRTDYEPSEFFEEREGNDQVTIEPQKFYLFGTREAVKLGSIWCELSRENASVGTGLWSHFAGSFNPGYQGSITLECINTAGNKRVIASEDPAGLVVADRVNTTVDPTYKSCAYQNQDAPKLPKVFKS